MRADPMPAHISAHFGGKRAVMCPDANTPKSTDFLEMQRRMSRVFLQEFVVFVGKLLRGLRQPVIQVPKVLAGEMVHVLIL